MPVTYTVSKARTQSMSFSGSGASSAGITVTWSQDYCVDVSGVDPATVSAYEVLSAPGIPIVNRTVYSTADKILPFVLCRDKTATQNPKKLSRWMVKTKFSTPQRSGAGGGGAGNSEEADNQPVDKPATIDSLASKWTVALKEQSRVLWRDKSANLLDTARTPTGNMWSSPVLERIPIFEAKLTQYEDAITFNQMVERKFKCNSDQWNDATPETWLITQVEAQDVDVELVTGTATKALVTYTLEFRPYLPPRDVGHREVRALFDTQYFRSDQDTIFDDLLLFESTQPGASKVGYIHADGTKRDDQSGEPDYIDYQIYDAIPFTFLKVPS